MVHGWAAVRLRSLGLVLLTAALVPVGLGQPLLVGVVPDLPGPAVGGEGFAVGAVGDVNLAGHQVTDGERTWTFPAHNLNAGGIVWVVGNVSDWRAHDGPEPVLAMEPPLQLGNDGDDLHLLAPDGRELDAMAYGDRTPDNPLPGGTIVLLRDGPRGGWVDTDRDADWSTPRVHRIGESRLDQPTFQVANITLYASPDTSFATLAALIAGSSQRLHLHVYELRSPDLVDLLVAARTRHPNLDLAVLVDGNPVGQSAEERHQTAEALHRIQQAGGQAVLAGNGRYDDHHLKVLVADDAVAVQSENWVATGVPRDPHWGNRGWGAILHDANAAQWFAQWLADDRAAWDSTPFDLATYDPTFTPPPRRDPRTGDYGPLRPALHIAGPVSVTPLVSPDHTQDPRIDPVAALLDDATHGIVAQHLDLARTARNDVGWQSPDPWFAALQRAAQRGVDVQVQLATPFSADDTGNALALADLAQAGAATGTLDRPGLATLHNKAFTIDGRLVVLGSTNGNHHARSENREVSLLLHSATAATWAQDLATSDWDPPAKPRDWSVPGQDLRGVPAAPWPILLALLGVAAALRARR